MKDMDKDEKTAGKRMQMLIKDYLNGIERILKKHAKGCSRSIDWISKKKTTDKTGTR